VGPAQLSTVSTAFWLPTFPGALQAPAAPPAECDPDPPAPAPGAVEVVAEGWVMDALGDELPHAAPRTAHDTLASNSTVREVARRSLDRRLLMERLLLLSADGGFPAGAHGVTYLAGDHPVSMSRRVNMTWRLDRAKGMEPLFSSWE
jgi:hypothetical protein